MSKQNREEKLGDEAFASREKLLARVQELQVAGRLVRN
jgi:hypothetical protein